LHGRAIKVKETAFFSRDVVEKAAKKMLDPGASRPGLPRELAVILSRKEITAVEIRDAFRTASMGLKDA
jgi:hypothetical protein